MTTDSQPSSLLDGVAKNRDGYLRGCPVCKWTMDDALWQAADFGWIVLLLVEDPTAFVVIDLRVEGIEQWWPPEKAAGTLLVSVLMGATPIPDQFVVHRCEVPQ